MRTLRVLSVAFAVSSLLLAACGDSGERPTCDALGETCHDSASAAGQACHEKAEDPATTEDECIDMEEACLAECP